LCGSIAFYFFYLIVAGAVLSNRLTHLQAKTLSLYQQVIPGATQATSPRVVLTRELQKHGQSNHRFFALLVALSEGLNRSPGISIVHLQFTGERLTATVQAKDFSTLEAWTSSFKIASIIFKQESAEQEGDHVTAHVQLEAKP
jgi:hypothetical protein